jgi:hypothetical protein
VDVLLRGPGGDRWSVALLDTGADDTIFPDYLAPYLGLDLTSAPPGEASVAGSAGVPLRYADIALRLTDGHSHHEWSATVGFTAVPMTYPVLGFAGCLQFFTATFHGDREEVELAVNHLYPGT